MLRHDLTDRERRLASEQMTFASDMTKTGSEFGGRYIQEAIFLLTGNRPTHKGKHHFDGVLIERASKLLHSNDRFDLETALIILESQFQAK